jgi:hypothetical protein
VPVEVISVLLAIAVTDDVVDAHEVSVWSGADPLRTATPR